MLDGLWKFSGPAFLGLVCATAVHGAVINEIRTDETGTDDDEYFEIAGTPGESLSGLSLVVLGDSSGGGSGVVERVYNLSGSIPADGYFLAAGASPMPTFPAATVDMVLSPATNIFENGDTLTFLLVTGNTAAVNNDLDTNDDGTFESAWYTTLLDSVAIIAPPGSELPYSTTQVGPAGSFAPSAIHRFPNGTGSWQYSETGFTNYQYDTPGAANVAIPEPSSLALLGLAGLGMVRRRRA